MMTLRTLRRKSEIEEDTSQAPEEMWVKFVRIESVVVMVVEVELTYVIVMIVIA